MTPHSHWIVVTTINPPTLGIRKLAELYPKWRLLIVADKKTPPDWQHPDVEVLSIEDQRRLGFRLSDILPYGHYARKNLGYLYAIAHGAEIIAETDDDNIPYQEFAQTTEELVYGKAVLSACWENVYRHFTSERIWPRGFPLEHIVSSLSSDLSLTDTASYICPIQQFLADKAPDVDAVHRLTTPGETWFQRNDIILRPGTWCPFNSQNTLWWPSAFTFLYLPSTASFRMTDIWRSFVALACLQAGGSNIAFRSATMFQERNEHNLLRDFADEISGYLHNDAIMRRLSSLPLHDTLDSAPENMRMCYEALLQMNILKEDERSLYQSWLADLADVLERRASA